MENSTVGIYAYDYKKIYLDIKKGIYKCLGTGSGRIVFDLEDGNVIKVARNRRGVAQNEAEYKIAKGRKQWLLANIIAVSEKYTYLIMEKAIRITKISSVWDYFNVRGNNELYRNNELQEICKKNNLEIKDFGRAANWGMINGRPVIIDYGFTRDVRRRYYSSPASRLLNKLLN